MEQPRTPARATESVEQPSLSHLPSPGPRWGLYARLSAAAHPSDPLSPEQADDRRREGEGLLDAEVLALRRMVQARGGTVTGIYRDVGPAASRAELHRAMYDAMMGGYDRLAVADLERLADDPVGVVGLVHALRDVGVGVTVLGPGEEPVDDPDLHAGWVSASSAALLARQRQRVHRLTRQV